MVVLSSQLTTEPTDVAKWEVPTFPVVEIELRTELYAVGPCQRWQDFFEELLEPDELDVGHLARAFELDRRGDRVAMLGLVAATAETQQVRELVRTTSASRDPMVRVQLVDVVLLTEAVDALPTVSFVDHLLPFVGWTGIVIFGLFV